MSVKRDLVKARRILPVECQRKHTGCDPMCEECCEAMDALQDWLRPRLEATLLQSIRSKLRELGVPLPSRIPYYVRPSLDEVGLRATEGATDYIVEVLRSPVEYQEPVASREASA